MNDSDTDHRPELWLETQALETAEFYVDVFSGRIGRSGRPKSEILMVSRNPQDMPSEVLTVEFHVQG